MNKVIELFKPINTSRKKTLNENLTLKYYCEPCSSKKDKFRKLVSFFVRISQAFFPEFS